MSKTEDTNYIEGLVLAQHNMREVDCRDAKGRRRCVDCGGWQLETESRSLFVPVLVGENQFGWICELCLLLRLKNRAQIVTATSSSCYNLAKVEKVIDARLAALVSVKATRTKGATK